MAKPTAEDTLVKVASENPRASLQATPNAALPMGEPSEAPLTQKRSQLRDRIRQLEGSLAYMGAAHPDKARYEQQLSMIRLMVAQIEAVMQDDRK